MVFEECYFVNVWRCEWYFGYCFDFEYLGNLVGWYGVMSVEDFENVEL